MIENNHFSKSGAPIFEYEIKTVEKLGELLYQEFNQGYLLQLDEQQIIEITNNQEEYIRVNVQNQIYSIQQIRIQFKLLTVIRFNQNKKQQKLRLSQHDGLIIQSQNDFVQATIFDFDSWCCITILKILDEDQYEFINNYFCQEKQFVSFEFETIIQQKYLLINQSKCKLIFYNEYIVQYERVRCIKYLEFLVQQQHQTNYSNYKRIEFYNTLNKQSFLDQFLLKSDVIKWIAQNFDYEENQNYQLFKQIRYKDEIVYKIPEIFIALGKFAIYNYVYIHNQSITGECLYGTISFEQNEIFVDISPSQYFVYFYENNSEPKFQLKSSIWRYRKPFDDYQIEILKKDKQKLINKIKLKGKEVQGRFILATKNKLFILFSQGMKITNLTNLFIHRIIGECNQKDEHEFYCYNEYCIISFIRAVNEYQYQYQVKFFD